MHQGPTLSLAPGVSGMRTFFQRHRYKNYFLGKGLLIKTSEHLLSGMHELQTEAFFGERKRV